MERYSLTLAAVRKNANLLQKDIAEMLGVTTQTVCHWETGIAEPSASQLQMISKITGIDEKYICLPKSPN